MCVCARRDSDYTIKLLVNPFALMHQSFTRDVWAEKKKWLKSFVTSDCLLILLIFFAGKMVLFCFVFLVLKNTKNATAMAKGFTQLLSFNKKQKKQKKNNKTSLNGLVAHSW